MSNPSIKLRGGASGPTFAPSTPGYVLTIDTDGQSVTPKPASGGGGAVTSVFTRDGDVVAENADYNSDQITNLSNAPGATVSDAIDGLDSSLIANVSNVAGATVTDALNALNSGGGAGVTSFHARTGVVVPTSTDYNSSLIANVSGVAGATVTEALNTLNGLAGVTSWKTRTGAVVPAAGDYQASQVDNDASVSGATVRDALNTLSTSDGITNHANVGGSTVTDALETLNQWSPNYSSVVGAGNPVPGNHALTADPAPFGLYTVSVSVSTTGGASVGAMAVDVKSVDFSGIERVQRVGPLLLTAAGTASATLAVASNGSGKLSYDIVVTTAITGVVTSFAVQCASRAEGPP